MPTEKEEVLERVTELRGFRYGLHDFYAEYDLEALKAVNQHVEDTYINTTTLDRKTKELALVIACVAKQDLVSHIQIHMHAANKAGASPEEIMAALRPGRQLDWQRSQNQRAGGVARHLPAGSFPPLTGSWNCARRL